MLELKLLNCTFSPFLISLASLSPHSRGTSESASAYTSTLKVQLPSSMGKKVTEAVICRKTDWISAWISASVFSSGTSLALVRLRVSARCFPLCSELSYPGSEFSFSWSAAVSGDLVFACLLKIWTCQLSVLPSNSLTPNSHQTAIARRARRFPCW